jgi:hypothetical protein
VTEYGTTKWNNYLEKDMDEIDFNKYINGHKNDGLKVEYLFY